MIKLVIHVNDKPIMQASLLHLIEARLVHPLKEGDKVEFIVEDDVAPVKRIFTETKQLKPIAPKG